MVCAIYCAGNCWEPHEQHGEAKTEHGKPLQSSHQGLRSAGARSRWVMAEPWNGMWREVDGQ